MNTEPITSRCPKCQAPLPANAPQGLCPKCLLAAVSTPTEAGQPVGNNPPPTIEAVAAAFPQLEILELIGQGGMGVVYKARQPKLDRLVALKVLPQSLAADAAFAERFGREARVLARLNHPNIVTVHDVGQSGGFFYLLMEFVDGVNLRQAMQAGRFTPQQAMMLVPKICEALQFAHDEGILHRDIKPANILLDTRGRVKIADFGIAKLVGEARENVTLTASGQAIGTPHYMAPEQLEHPQDVDQRADIYSLGVVFYEMLTGELPIGRFAPPSEKSAVDPRVDEVVFHALEREREKRFGSAGEVKTSVEAITSNPAVVPGQPAMPGEPAGPSPGAAIPERRIPCHISTPEHLSTFTGQAFYIYTGKGELRLDAENLTFVSNWQSTVIPLQDIRELGIGHYSRLAKPLRLDYMAVTFDQAGQRRTLLFTPASASSFIQIPWEANERVAECFQAVREAVIARTGTPPVGPSTPVPPPATFASGLREALQLVLPICVLSAVIAGLVTLLAHASNGISRLFGQGAGAWFPSGNTIMLMSGAFFVFGLIAWATLKRKQPPTLHGAPDAPLSPSPAVTVILPTAASPAARRARCYFSTPERMQNCFPGAAAHLFLCDGELRLEADRLQFTSSTRSMIVIPLKRIQGFSLGLFRMWNTPWLGVKYERLNYLAVSYTENNLKHTVMLTPVPDEATSATAINSGVAAWFDAVQAAILSQTGALPAPADRSVILTGVQGPWLRAIGPLLAIGAGSSVVTAFLKGPAQMAPVALSFIVAAIIGLLCIGYHKMNATLRSGKLDTVTSDEPLGELPADGAVTSAPVGNPRRPLAWTISAWIFIAIGILGVIDTLAMLYKRPFEFTLYPGWAHLFAGVALLTLSRRWRMASFVVLVLMGVGGAVLGLNMILSPGGAVVLLPAAGMKISVAEQPFLAAAGAVFLTLIYAWPWYLLLGATGRRLFARPPR